MLKILESAGVKFTSYHGGSSTGTDIKKFIAHAPFVFDSFETLLKEKNQCDAAYYRIGEPSDFYSDAMSKFYKSTFIRDLHEYAIQLKKKYLD